MKESYNDKNFSAVSLKENPAEEKGKKESLDSLGYEEIIHSVDKEIFSIADLEEKDISSLNDAIRAKKVEFLDKVDEANRNHLANILFGLEELALRNKIAAKSKVRTEYMKIEDAKLQQEIAYFIGDNEKDFKLLGDFWNEYEKIFEYNGDKTGDTLKHGILAPIALKNILESKYNGKSEKRLEFIYSTPEDDVKKSIDMIAIDNKSKLNMLIQVKGDAMNQKEVEIMVRRGLNSKSNNNQTDKSSEEMELITVIDEKEFSAKDTSMGGKINTFNSGCSRYFTEHEKTLKESGYKTVGIYIYVPSVVSGEVWIDLNGHPNKKLSKLIGELLDLKLDGIAK